jgi:hypothetical protein
MWVGKIGSFGFCLWVRFAGRGKTQMCHCGQAKNFIFLCGGSVLIFLRVGLFVAKVRFSVKEQRKCQPNKSRPKDLFESVCLVVFEIVGGRVGSLRLLPTFVFVPACG